MYSKYGWLLILTRGFFYAGFIAFLYKTAASGNESLQGISGGIILADFITWLGRSIIKLYRYPAEFAWEALINIIIVLVLVYAFDISFPSQGEGMAIGIMAFFVVCGLKVLWYVGQEMSAEG
ncbi:MAG: hypothetical protein JW699_06490 [Chitinispirillaceae bacterium]|nr:hypothetical protein [Chitinispirillaceae bacterium]